MEVDLNDEERTQTPRECRAAARNRSRERTRKLVQEAACRSQADEGEATAPHRIAFLKRRLHYRVPAAESVESKDHAAAPQVAEPSAHTVPRAALARASSLPVGAAVRCRPAYAKTADENRAPKATAAAIRALTGS